MLFLKREAASLTKPIAFSGVLILSVSVYHLAAIKYAKSKSSPTADSVQLRGQRVM